MLSLFLSRSGSAHGVGRLIVMLAALVALFAAVLSPAASAQEAEENEAPVAVAFARGSAEVNPSAVNPGDRVELDGTLSFDPDGLPEGADLTYQWTPGPGFAWLPISNGGSGPTAGFIVPPAGYGDEIMITLTVTDLDGATSMQTVTVTYNNPPVFENLGTGPDGTNEASNDNTNPPQPDPDDTKKLLVNTSPETRNVGIWALFDNVASFPVSAIEGSTSTDDFIYPVDEGDTIQLSVRATDPDRTAVSYSWEQIHGDVLVPLTVMGRSATFTAPDVPPPNPMNPASVLGETYDVAYEVTATDADGGTVRQIFYLRVFELDVAPVADGGPNQDSALSRSADDARVLVQLSAAGTTDADPYDIPVDIPAASSPTGIPIERNIVYTWEVVRLETAAGVSDTDIVPMMDDPDNPGTDIPTETGELINQLKDMRTAFTWVADFNPALPGLQDEEGMTGTGEVLRFETGGGGGRNYNLYDTNSNDAGEAFYNSPDIYLRMLVASERCDGNGNGACSSAPDGDPDEHPLLGGSVYVGVTAWSVVPDLKVPGMDGARQESLMRHLTAASQRDVVEIRISEDPNEVPVVEAAVVGSGGRLVSDDVSVFEGEPVSLTAVQSEDDNENDPDFDGLTYIWTQTEPDPINANGQPLTGANGALSDANPNNDVCVNCAFGASHRLVTRDAVQEVVFTGDVTGLEIARPGRRARRDDFRFSLTVLDQYGVAGRPDSTGSNIVTITVVEANEAPVVDAGDDQTVADGDEVSLAASATDPDLSVEDSTETHTFVWEQTGGPEVELVDGGTATASFVAAGGAEGATLEFMVTVTDARGLSDSDTVTITVAAAAEPEEPEPVDFPMVLEAGQQIGAEMLVASMSDRYAQLVALACDTAVGTGSDSDICATGELGPVPGAPADPDTFYSGPIDSASFCITFGAENNGLRLYAFDGDGDGVAETCVLPWSEREAAARQAALLQLGQDFLESQGS